MPETPTRAPVIERHVRVAGDATLLTWGIAVETAVEIRINGAAWTVMMSTPADLQDLALGLALTERVIDDARAVEAITIADYLDGIIVEVVAAAAAVNEGARRQRTLEGRAGCGLCGVEALASLPMRRNDVVRSRSHIDPSAVRAAFDALATEQPLNRATHSLHAAAWCRPDGTIELVREDVGRHNALDKVIGAMARAARLDEAGFVVMTSRCSFELVYKAAATRAGALATISAPTSLALDWAAMLDLPLLCRARDGGVIEFPTGGARAG